MLKKLSKMHALLGHFDHSRNSNIVGATDNQTWHHARFNMMIKLVKLSLRTTPMIQIIYVQANYSLIRFNN